MRSGFPAWLGAVSPSIRVSARSIFGGKAVEEPTWLIVLEVGAIQIREYGAYAVAEMAVNTPFDTAMRTGLGRLFDYISGANRGSSKIEMTAPVVVAPERIAMTAPVVAARRPVC